MRAHDALHRMATAFVSIDETSIRTLRAARDPTASRLTDSRDGGDNLAELELVEDGGLTGGIETDHKNTWVLVRML